MYATWVDKLCQKLNEKFNWFNFFPHNLKILHTTLFETTQFILLKKLCNLSKSRLYRQLKLFIKQLLSRYIYSLSFNTPAYYFL